MIYTKESTANDLRRFCKDNGYTDTAPPMATFLEAMPYTQGALKCLWSELVVHIGMKCGSKTPTGKRTGSPYRQKGLHKSKNTLQSVCNCGNIYHTEVDHKGSRLNRRCDECKSGEASKVDYSGYMAEALYNTVPEDGDIPKDLKVDDGMKFGDVI